MDAFAGLLLIGITIVVAVWFLASPLRILNESDRLVVVRFGHTGPGLGKRPGIASSE
jgi:regulator of protease activity HflC (stomatin/prohibitin superfamily)